MRKGLIVLFSVGTVLGFGSGFARLAHRGSCHERWSQHYEQGGPGYGYGYGRFDRFDRTAPVAAPAPAPVAAPAPAPVYIVVPQAAPAAQAPVIVNNAPPTPAPVINVAPTPAAAQ
jgi:hypothetical protein